jgi:hypothetical protein
MATFTFKEVIAEGSANINPETGETTVNTTVVTTLSGLVKPDMLLTDSVKFVVDSKLSITEAWADISKVQAPKWVETNYSNS